MKIKRLLTVLLALTFIAGMISIPAAAETSVEVKAAYFSIDDAMTAKVTQSVQNWLNANNIQIDGKELSSITFTKLTKDQIASGALSNYDVFLMGAGTAEAIGNALGSAASAKIEEFVANGGGYLGIEGAGAYAGLRNSAKNDYSGYLELINLNVDYVDLNHGEGQAMTRLMYFDPTSSDYNYNHTIITNGMEMTFLKQPYFITYVQNPPVLTAGSSTNAKMGKVINVMTHTADIVNNLDYQKREAGNHVSMQNTPVVAAASYGSGFVVVSTLGIHRDEQPVPMDYLTGQMLLCAAGVKEIKVVPVSEDRGELKVVGEWLWASEVHGRGPNGAEIMMERAAEMGVNDIYLLVKGTGGTVSFLKSETALAKAYNDRDILQEVIDAAHKRGIKVHAWYTSAFDTTYAAKYPDEVMYHYRNGRNQETKVIHLRSENYIKYMKDIITEMVTNYDVDGIHFDYIRYNHIANGWGPEDSEQMAEYGIDEENLRSYMVKTFYAEPGDGFSIFKAHADGVSDVVKLAQMRRDNVVNFAKELISAAKAVKPNIIADAALMPEGSFQGDYNIAGMNSQTFALLHYGQDHTDAVELYDYVCPMLYSRTFNWSAQCLLSLVQNCADLGNKVVGGLEFFNSVDRAQLLEGVLSISTKQLDAEINGIRELAKKDPNVIGAALFRTGVYSYAKTVVDEGKKAIHIKVFGAHTSYGTNRIILDVAEGITITKILGADGLKEGPAGGISADGKTVTISGGGAVGQASMMPIDGIANIYLEYEGTINKTLGAGLVRCVLNTDLSPETRVYNLFERGSVTVPSNITPLPEVTPTPEPTPTPSPTPKVEQFTVQECIDAFVAAYAEYEANPSTETLPETIKIGSTAIIRLPSYFKMMCQLLLNISSGDTTSPIINEEYDPCANPTNADSFNKDTISKEGYLYAALRQRDFITSNKVPANYVTFPGSSGLSGYEGQLSFTRSSIAFARVFKAYKETGKLPDEVSTEWRHNQQPAGTPIPVDKAVNALDGVYAAYLITEGTLPESIQIDSMTLNKASYFRLACQLLVNLDKGDTTSQIPYVPCNETDGEGAHSLDTSVMSRAGYINAATRQLEYIKNNNVPAKVVSYPGSFGEYNGQLAYRNCIIAFARVAAYYKANGALPNEVSVEDVIEPPTPTPTVSSTPTPTVSPTPTPTVSPTPTPTVSPTPTIVIPSQTPGNYYPIITMSPVETPSGQAPKTGDNSIATTLIGLIVIAAGAAIFMVTRKKEE